MIVHGGRIASGGSIVLVVADEGAAIVVLGRHVDVSILMFGARSGRRGDGKGDLRRQTGSRGEVCMEAMGLPQRYCEGRADEVSERR